MYTDNTSQDLARQELAGVVQQQVLAWELDAFRRGVEILLDDATVTSFSAEFPVYLHDADYRRRVDARRGPAGDDLGERVAARVRAERERHGWSVTDLARHAEMAASNVHRVESGKHVPAMPTMMRLAEALEVPLGRLVGR